MLLGTAKNFVGLQQVLVVAEVTDPASILIAVWVLGHCRAPSKPLRADRSPPVTGWIFCCRSFWEADGFLFTHVFSVMDVPVVVVELDDLGATVGELILVGSTVPFTEVEGGAQLVHPDPGGWVTLIAAAQKIIHMQSKDCNESGWITTIFSRKLNWLVEGQEQTAIQRVLHDCSFAHLQSLRLYELHDSAVSSRKAKKIISLSRQFHPDLPL